MNLNEKLLTKLFIIRLIKLYKNLYNVKILTLKKFSSSLLN